ncbi:MAG: DNA repair protein RadC [Muribaculum sp.]|nr:DNA repair protein RadC [Muribaculum sp.]
MNHHPMSDSPLTVKDFDPCDQPRERALEYGCKALAAPDLWAIILRAGVPGTPITTLCRNLMTAAGGNLHNLERFPRERMMELPGIGITKALQIEAVIELIHRYNTEKIDPKEPISSSRQIFEFVKEDIANLDHEEVWALFINRRNQVIDKMRVTSGSSVASIFDIKAIVRQAILAKAEGLAMAHNHPSGNLRPSIQDDDITHKLFEACKVFELRMLDHVIVSREGYYSYFDQGRLR